MLEISISVKTCNGHKAQNCFMQIPTSRITWEQWNFRSEIAVFYIKLQIKQFDSPSVVIIICSTTVIYQSNCPRHYEAERDLDRLKWRSFDLLLERLRLKSTENHKFLVPCATEMLVLKVTTANMKSMPSNTDIKQDSTSSAVCRSTKDNYW